jgi:N-acetylglucosaminyldiphosphoundecaprenol N-acetyl-beta-D-mannosaminyltransferase
MSSTSLLEGSTAEARAKPRRFFDPVHVFGLDVAPLDLDQAVDHIEDLVAAGEPKYIITANLNYAMLSHRNKRLENINGDAAFMVADGMPLVLAARLQGTPLPGRTTGADLVPRLCARAAERGLSIFLLGGTDEATGAAAAAMRRKWPKLRIAGVECPMLDALDEEAMSELVERIRLAKPDILLAAFGQPKGEFWIADHYRRLGGTVCIQIGASLDFIAGAVRRAPGWMQRGGLEWLHRLYSEPRRLLPRYTQNACFLFGAVARTCYGSYRRKPIAAGRTEEHPRRRIPK